MVGRRTDAAARRPATITRYASEVLDLIIGAHQTKKAAIAPFDPIEWTSTKLRMGSNHEREYWL
jgi:hypothetical protein